jgi:carboxymethylenebutenolidase
VRSATGELSEESFKALHELSPDKAPPPRGVTVPIAGTTSYLSLPGGSPPHPGILVIHEWWGLNDHIRHWADRLAADGYAALAVDLYEGRVAGDADSAMAYVKRVDESRAAAVIAAGHDFLRESERVKAPRTGVLGWCFGGGWSLRSAMAIPDLDAAVLYYGMPETDPEKLKSIRAPICGIFGNQDPSITPEIVDRFATALREAGVANEIHRYDAGHAFANPSGRRYAEAPAAAAWDVVRAFLAAHLKSPRP